MNRTNQALLIGSLILKCFKVVKGKSRGEMEEKTEANHTSRMKSHTSNFNETFPFRRVFVLRDAVRSLASDILDQPGEGRREKCSGEVMPRARNAS